MQPRRTAIVAIGLVLVLGGCAGAAPRTAPAASSPTGITAPIPTPIAQPTRSPSAEVVLVAPGEAPQLTCGGGMISGADIDYVAGATGVADIVAATLSLGGVQSADVVFAEQTVTVITRQGEPIWRGHWMDTQNGFLLDHTEQCHDAGIGAGRSTSPRQPITEQVAIELARNYTSLNHLVSATRDRFGDLGADAESTGLAHSIPADREVWYVAFDGVQEECGGPSPGRCRTLALTLAVLIDQPTGAFLGSETHGTEVDGSPPA